MVIARKSKIVGNSFVVVGHAVVVGVFDARQLGALHHQNLRIADNGQPERIMQALGKFFPDFSFGVVSHHFP